MNSGGIDGLVGSHVGTPDSPQVGAVGGEQQLHFQSGSGLNDGVSFHPSDTLMGLPADLPTTSRDDTTHVTDQRHHVTTQPSGSNQSNLKSEQ